MAVPPGGLKQAGVALVTALMMVALATLAAVTLASRQQIDVRRSATFLNTNQALAYADGVEAWAVRLLRRDQLDNNVDHPGEDWARELPPILVEGGQVSGRIEDLQGRYNINNLLTPEGRIDATELERFRRLLATLDLPLELANAVADWLDADLEARFPGGAEDYDYLALDPPYRAANRAMTSLSELRLVRGVDEAAWRRLASVLTALPTPTPLNVNTASPAVLRMLDETLTAQEAAQLVEARGDEGFATVQDFLALELLAGRKLEADALSVSSQYFLLRADVRIGTARIPLLAVIRREEAGVRVIRHARGAL